MAAMGVTAFVEVGPGMVLSSLIKRILPDAVTLSVNDPHSFEVTRAAFSA
jgi:[acyl-carrier-protein] S-malonyltransferase